MQLLPRIFDGVVKYSPKSLGEYTVGYFQALSATDYDTIAYGGADYKVYRTFTIPWCGTQAGNVKPIQLTKKIKLYADHYANKPAGVINAKQWAASNGFDVEGIENLADLDFYVGEETNLSAYPCLMDEKTLDKLGGFSNFLAYVQSQSSEYVIPVVMADLYSFYTRAGGGVSLLPEEIQNAPAISSEPLPLHAGDSGKPVFLTVEDYDGNRKDILLTHIYQLTNGWGSVPVQGFGPNMTKAFDIIKAFCEANNEQLNVFEVNSMTTDNMTQLCLNGKEVKELYIDNKLVWEKAAEGHADTWYKYAGDTEWRTVSITGALTGGEGVATTQIPDVYNIVELEVGTDVTNIGSFAFFECSSLTSVTIPDSVTSIGIDAFFDCTSTTDVYCYPNPANLTWNEDGKDDFKSDGSTLCHVKAEYLTAYQTKFGDEVNVTFVGDLA